MRYAISRSQTLPLRAKSMIEMLPLVLAVFEVFVGSRCFRGCLGNQNELVLTSELAVCCGLLRSGLVVSAAPWRRGAMILNARHV